MNAIAPLVGTYNIALVLLSLVIAVITAYTALDLAGRVTANRGTTRTIWLLGGAVAMGSGIWSMHFTGMLAFRLPIPVYYHVPTVVFSLFAAIVASLIALYVVSRKRMTRTHILAGSCLMGAAVATMHYTGMAAMRMQAMHRYNPGLWLLSVVLAVAISAVGLLLIFYSRDGSRGLRLKAASALVIGLAIPVMHYTGMAAITFVPMPDPPSLLDSIDITTLAHSAILGITFVVLGFALLTSLIDRRLSAQQLVLESERKMLRTLIDNIPDFMYVKDRESRFVIANPAVARNVGLKNPQELIGRSDFDLFPPELARGFFSNEQQIMNTGIPLFNHEEIVCGEGGEMIPVLTTKVPLRDGKGQVTGLAGVGRNIGERKKSETALREAERKYRGIFDEAIVGIFQVSPDGRLIDANRALGHILGYGSAEEMLASLTDPWRVPIDSKRQAEFVTVMRESERVQNFECEVLRKDGRPIWLSSSVRSMYADGVLTRYEGMTEDVTERKLLRDQLFQAQKLESVGQLAAGIAHEINTPTQFIGDNVRFLKDTFTDLATLLKQYGELLHNLREGTSTPAHLEAMTAAVQRADVEYLLDEIPHAIEQTLEGVSRVATLVGAMKEFSHPGTKEKVPLDLNHAIESTITVARNEWKYVADMEMDFDPGLPLVPCQPGEFNQVILNMIVNAAHAIADVTKEDSAQRGTIRIATKAVPTGVEIRIADTGSGIPVAVRERIFDPFFTTKEIGKGTGQGLAIARSVIVDKHQGTIDFETTLGQGTTFIIRLPALAVAPSREPVAV